MKTISFRLPDKMLVEIENLVNQGLYANRTEALREGARMLLRTQIGSLLGSPKEISKDELWEDLVKEIKSK